MKAALLAACCAPLLALATPAHSATTIDREFRFANDRVKVVRQADLTLVDATRSTREFTPGRPDLPWVSETIDLPGDAQVIGVEVLEAATEPLAEAARIPSAMKLHPGLGPVERTLPDPAVYARDAFVPERLALLGGQGWQRGRRLATLQLSPVRWNPASGRLERVTHLRVRLTLEPGPPSDLGRERIVREWEDDAPSRPLPREWAGRMVSLSGRSAEPFKPTQLPSVLGSPVEYVIITNDAMASTFQTLADWKTQSGVPAVVRTLSFIQANYPFGSDDAERIRMFIRDAYQRWGTKWILLGGDTDILPTRLAYTTFYTGENIACDMYFQCLDGNWNADGDSSYGEGYTSTSDPGDNVDLYPEVYVGRAPVTNVTEANRFITKTFQYTRTPVGNYENTVLFFAEVLFPQDWTPSDSTTLDGAELVEECLPSLQTNPAIHFARLYENYLDGEYLPGALQETKARVLDSLDVGYNICVHIGHGYRNVMSVANGQLNNIDAESLTNGNKLFNLYATNCTSNAIDYPCIGEAFMLAANGGAVTNIGSSRFDFPTAGRAYQKEYFRLLYEDSVNAIGELEARQKLPFVPFSTYDGVNRWTQMTLLLLGDPELRVWTGKPRTLAVTGPASVGLSDSSFLVHVQIGGTPLANARVTAYRANDEFTSLLTNASGDAVVGFRPDSVGSFTLTVTGYDCKPYQATVPIVASSQPVLVERGPTADDDNVGGTVGNNNGQVDAGETVDLRVPLKNNGGATANGVGATLSTASGALTITNPSASYGSIAPGATVQGTFRITVPYTAADQVEVPFKLTVTDNASRSWIESFQIVLHAPDVKHFSHSVVEVSGGNGNGRPDPGETINYLVKLRNLGTGIAEGVSLKLRCYDGLSTVTDSTASFGNIAAGAEVTGDAVTFSTTSLGGKLALVVSDQYGVLYTQMLDLTYPTTPTDLLGQGSSSSIKLTWTHLSTADLTGYNLYRSSLSVGPYIKDNPVPTDRTSYYRDEGLAPLTKYYYKVSSVDSSGNESSLSAFTSASTNPPLHGIFPIPMDRNTPSSVAIDRIYQSNMMDIVAGADKLYLVHADGSAPVDADGAGNTQGDFTTLGNYYAAGPSIADLDGGGYEIIAPTWDTYSVYAFDTQGNVKPGWPVFTFDPIWSSAAIGDLDNDGVKEVVFGSNGNKVYAFRADGTEWRDGDSNAGTVGVFKVLGSPYNFATPALADIDGDDSLDVVYGSYDGNLYAWHANGTSLPGFPFHTTGNITDSPAIGYLDGPSDTQPEIVFASTNDSLYVVEPNGTRRPGWPVWERFAGGSKTPSPALADMDGDGNLDIVAASTNGGMYWYKRDGVVLKANQRYSTLTSAASESSPVVGDINGDGVPDIVMGDENAQLTVLNGATGAVLNGFPIQLDGEVRGTPAVCDCDGDGLSEIVVADWDKNLYMWDYDSPFSPSGPPPWPQFHHDAARTGFASNPVFTGAPSSSGVPGAIELSSPAPNPTRGGSRIWCGVPAAREGARWEVAIFDLSGRRLRTVGAGIAKAGRFSVEWDLRSDAGLPVDAGVYFVRFSLGGAGQTRKVVVLK